MTTRFTLSDRALMHLYRYRHIPVGTELGAPSEMTQDGIAGALGISRSHAALITNRLEEGGRLESGKSRIVGQMQGGPRKVYFITPIGIRECECMLAEAQSKNIDDSLIMPNNINYCSSAMFWNLPLEDRMLIGCMFVLRTPVRRSDLDDAPQILPFDHKGRLAIKPETRRWYISRADTDTLKSWHSAAADWCTDRRCDPKERLYHLFRSGRRTEAEKLVESQRFMFMDFPDKESRDMIEILADDGQNRNLLMTAARMSLRMGETLTARKEMDRISSPGDVAWDSLMSEILLAEGQKAKALDTALNTYVGDIDSSAALGICMTANGRYDEALTFLGRCRNEMHRTGCVFRLDEILSTQSEALRGMGDTVGADQYLEMAECWRKDPQHRFRSE